MEVKTTKKKTYVSPRFELYDLQPGLDFLVVSGVDANLDLPFTGGGNGFTRSPGFNPFNPFNSINMEEK